MFVYLITNNINGKQYVGQHSGKDLNRYFQKNVYKALNDYNYTRALYGAIRKYGVENFQIKPLVIVNNKWELDLYERGMIKSLNTKAPNGYNLTDGGDGVFNPSDELRKRMSESHKGLKQSEETKLKRAFVLRGQKRSEETKQRMSKALKGNQNGLGHIKSEETRKKISLANIGNKNAVGAIRTPAYCKQKSESQKGRKFSDDTRRKMSEAAKGGLDTEETKRKKSISAIARGVRPPKLTSAELARAGLISCHKRYHIARNIINPKCSLCIEATNVAAVSRLETDQTPGQTLGGISQSESHAGNSQGVIS